MALTQHTSEQRAYIVAELARYVTPVEIVKAFARKWKATKCDEADVAACEQRHLSGDWLVYFDQVREEYLAAPIGDKQFRIAELHKHYVTARDRGAVSEALKILEQAAKDAAGFYDGKSKAEPPGAAEGDVVAITRTIVDPTPVAAVSE